MYTVYCIATITKTATNFSATCGKLNIDTSARVVPEHSFDIVIPFPVIL